MPLREELLEAMAESRRREAEEADRDRRRDFVRTACACLAWCAAGLLVMGWGFYSTDPVLGRAALYLGAGGGNAGIIFSILGLYRRGERRGDW
jgi:hypothetical protein